jgi:hypothetical protein
MWWNKDCICCLDLYLLADKWTRESCYCEVWISQVELYWHFRLLHSISDIRRYNYNNRDRYEEVTCDWNYGASPVSATGCLSLWYAFVAITLVCFSDFFDVHFVYTAVLISPYLNQEGNKLQQQKILMFVYPIYNHNWRNISTIHIYNKTSIKWNILTITQNTSGSRSS